uniref:Uncharacterized protein n=1 Tax=Cannabis sativa TaxID=3483 RepID=A0A803PTU0_CANSA
MVRIFITILIHKDPEEPQVEIKDVEEADPREPQVEIEDLEEADPRVAQLSQAMDDLNIRELTYLNILEKLIALIVKLLPVEVYSSTKQIPGWRSPKGKVPLSKSSRGLKLEATNQWALYMMLNDLTTMGEPIGLLHPVLLNVLMMSGPKTLQGERDVLLKMNEVVGDTTSKLEATRSSR